MMRRTNDLMGHEQEHRNPTVPLVPGQEYGWLTAIKQSAGDGRFTVLRCRCGETVIRASRTVRVTVKNGLTSMCPTCLGKSKAARAKKP